MCVRFKIEMCASVKLRCVRQVERRAFELDSVVEQQVSVDLSTSTGEESSWWGSLGSPQSRPVARRGRTKRESMC